MKCLEGNFKNSIKEGNGIYYFNNGDKELRKYYNGEHIGKHMTIYPNGEQSIKYYN